MRHSAIRTIVLLWFVWLVIIWAYQATVTARYNIQKPDHVLFWTASHTAEQKTRQPYLADPFMNAQVGWDSEFYLSIALQGYDDPLVRAVPPTDTLIDRPLSLNYAFFPAYPYLIRWVAVPLSVLGLTPIATATLAGVLISAIGTLVGMIALYDLTSQVFGSETGLRTTFYLISFPTSFFLTQVYTEGLFVGLSFGCLALIQRKHWLAAGLLAAFATLTRAVGIVLIIPLLFTGLKDWKVTAFSWRNFLPNVIFPIIASLIPITVHWFWRTSFLGEAFRIVEERFFNCRLFNLSTAAAAWGAGVSALFGDNSAARVYYVIEFAAILLGLFSCLITLKRYPGISLYGLITIIISLTCGTAWSISRYLLTVPSIFLVLGRLGQSQLFDRVWSLISILLLAMLTALFSFDLWVG